MACQFVHLGLEQDQKIQGAVQKQHITSSKLAILIILHVPIFSQLKWKDYNGSQMSGKLNS